MNLTDDDFALFGLPRQFVVDLSDLEANRTALQAKVHPDRFSTEGAAAQRLSMQWAVRVNEAYQRLKDPLKRAAYLCELQGVAVQAENNTAMPVGFLMQQMEWREALDEAQTVQALETIYDEVSQVKSAQLQSLAKTMDEKKDWTDASQQVRALMFIDRFMQDVNQRIESLED